MQFSSAGTTWSDCISPFRIPFFLAQASYHFQASFNSSSFPFPKLCSECPHKVWFISVSSVELKSPFATQLSADLSLELSWAWCWAELGADLSWPHKVWLRFRLAADQQLASSRHHQSSSFTTQAFFFSTHFSQIHAGWEKSAHCYEIQHIIFGKTEKYLDSTTIWELTITSYPAVLWSVSRFESQPVLMLSHVFIFKPVNAML